MAAPLQRSGEYDCFFRTSPSALDQWWTLRTLVMSLCRLCLHSSHPSNLQNRTSARLLMSLFHGGAERRGQIRELRVPMSPQMPHGKILFQTENKIILLTPLADYFACFKQKLT